MIISLLFLSILCTLNPIAPQFIASTAASVSRAAPEPVTQTITQTPDAWIDPRIDSIERETMSEMISFSPPPIPSGAIWLNTDADTPRGWEAFRGKVVVVQSWTNATPAGRQAFSTVSKMISRLKNNNVVLITIHTPEKMSTAFTYAAKTKTTPPILLDSTGSICNSLGFYKHPTNILIDKNGAVQFVGLRPTGVQKAIKELVRRSYDPDKKTRAFNPTNNTPTVKSSYPTHALNFGRATNMQGKPAPSFFVQSWITPNPQTKDEVRVLEFWATWCPPCIKSIPHINKLANHFRGTVSFVGVSGETKQKVSSFVKKTLMEYGVAVDQSKQMQTAIGCSAIPLALVISADNTVRWQGNPSKLTEQIIQQVIDADNGTLVPVKRGKWDSLSNNG